MCQIQATDLDVCVCMHNEQKRRCWMLSALSKLWNLTRNALSFFLVLDRPLWCRERSQQGEDVHGHCWFRGLLLLTLTSVASCSLLNIHKQIKTLQLIGWPPFHSLTHSAACSALRFVSFYRESHGPCWIEAPRGMFVRFDCQFAYTGRRDCTHTHLRTPCCWLPVIVSSPFGWRDPLNVPTKNSCKQTIREKKVAPSGI